MPVVIPDDYAMCRLHYRLSGDSEEMITTFGVGEVGGAFSADDVAGAIATDVVAELTPAAAMYNDWTFARVTVTLMRAGLPELGESTQNIVGTRGAAQSPPNNVALLVRKTSALGGRANRGRFYFPPCTLAEGQVNSYGVLSAGELAAQTGDWEDFYDALEADAEFDNVVILHSGAGAPTPVTQFAVEPQVATQRQRLRR